MTRIYWQDRDVQNDPINYCPEARELWSEDHRLFVSHCESQSLQVVAFLDEPGRYYIRVRQHKDVLLYNFTRDTCLPDGFASLDEAKAAAEMIELSGIASSLMEDMV